MGNFVNFAQNCEFLERQWKKIPGSWRKDLRKWSDLSGEWFRPKLTKLRACEIFMLAPWPTPLTGAWKWLTSKPFLVLDLTGAWKRLTGKPFFDLRFDGRLKMIDANVRINTKFLNGRLTGRLPAPVSPSKKKKR